MVDEAVVDEAVVEAVVDEAVVDEVGGGRGVGRWRSCGRGGGGWRCGGGPESADITGARGEPWEAGSKKFPHQTPAGRDIRTYGQTDIQTDGPPTDQKALCKVSDLCTSQRYSTARAPPEPIATRARPARSRRETRRERAEGSRRTACLPAREPACRQPTAQHVDDGGKGTGGPRAGGLTTTGLT